MNAAAARWALLVPLLGYALVRVVLAAPPLGLLELVALIAVALPAVEVATDRLRVWAYLPGAAVLLVLAAEAWAGAWETVDALAVGVLIGAPLWLLGGAWRIRSSLAGSILSLVGAVELALIELSVAGAIGPTAVGAPEWIRTLTTILGSQAESVASFGGGNAIPPSTLAAVPDALFVVLALVPLAGLLVTALLPMRLETSPTGTPGAAGHAAALLAAVGAVGAFEVAATVWSADLAIVGLAVAIGEVLVALSVSTWRPARRPRRAPAAVRSTARGPPLPR